MTSVRLELPLPPSMNVYWRRGPNRARNPKFPVVTHISAEGREFRQIVKLTWFAKRGVPQFTGPVSVFAALWFPTMASDVDNRIKPTLDALEHAGVVKNDRQVARLEFYRAGTVGRNNEGTMLIEVAPHAWESESLEDFKRVTNWDRREG